MKSPNVVIKLHANRAQRRRALRKPEASTHIAAKAPTSPEADAPIDRALLEQAVMLNWLGQQPVSFHRSYVDVTGNVVAALWLSYAMDKMTQASTGILDSNGDLVFAMTGKECEQDTGITLSQQVTCRRLLIKQGLLTEEGSPGRTVRYRIRVDRLVQRLLLAAKPMAVALSQSDPAVGSPRLPTLRQTA